MSAAVERVVVVGGGVMGSGIAQVVAGAGLEVTLVDVAAEALERARAKVARNLDRLVDSGRAERADADATLARIETSTDLAAAAGAADHAIETVVEDFEIKAGVLRQLDESLGEEAVIASNTSQFSISRLAAATSRPDRVIGSHWFNPPPLMDLIEVIRGVETSTETLAATLALAERYGRQTVLCNKDTPGFITSRLIVTLMLEALRIVEEGIADADDVDLACRQAFNHAMGPLETMDFSGLDTTLHVAENMRDQYGERFLAPQNLQALVAAGHLGRKSGRGIRFAAEPE
jgi:3-hydroxybutyryl-CoA dehydrogenase